MAETVHLFKEAGVYVLLATPYKLIFPADRPFVYLDDSFGNRLAELFVLSSAHSNRGRDDTTSHDKWQVVHSTEAEVHLRLDASSSIWRRKSYHFAGNFNRFRYWVEVEGDDLLSEVTYFGGYSSAQPRWGSGFFWSAQHFRVGFNPEPNKEGENYFQPSEGTSIDLMGVPLPGKSHWFFTPPPFCFAFKTKRTDKPRNQDSGQWVGIGVEAAPGENRFTEYSYRGKQSAFVLSLDFEGYTQVKGGYRLPAIGFDFASGEFLALEAHVRALQEAGFAPVGNGKETPEWWHGPIFCGWGAQNACAQREKGWAPDYSRQDLYTGFLSDLKKHELDPGIVVLDDKWQATYGDNQVDRSKWPDLERYIHGQHQQGRKVLLWLKAWDPEGIPIDECICNSAGLPLSVDPSNPAYQKRLRAGVRRMLAPDGYDADGFKIDFTARIPSGPGMKLHGSLWGLELMKLYLSILYEEAKSVKNDALLIAHTPHPYLADVVDMIRLNDIIKEKDVEREMRIRAKVASIACPGAIIDTDNWPVVNRAAWRKYLGIQAELGIPSLYFTTHIDVTGEPLQEEDYRRLRSVWAKHRMRNDATNRRRKESPLATLAFLKPCLGQIRTWALKFRQTCPEKRSGKAARST